MRRVGRLADLHVEWRRVPRFERHLQRVERRMRGLALSGAEEINVLAILAVESFYRPRIARALEYVTWALLSALSSTRVATLSVGVSQAQLCYWEDLGLIDGHRFSPERLAGVARLDHNYAICAHYLRARGALSLDDSTALGDLYAGGARRHYVSLLTAARAAAISWANE